MSEYELAIQHKERIQEKERLKILRESPEFREAIEALRTLLSEFSQGLGDYTENQQKAAYEAYRVLERYQRKTSDQIKPTYREPYPDQLER